MGLLGAPDLYSTVNRYETVWAAENRDDKRQVLKVTHFLFSYLRSETQYGLRGTGGWVWARL